MAVATGNYKRPKDLLKTRKELEMEMKQEMIGTVGIPACGKSTWARKFMECWPDRYVRVERDVIRAENHTLTGNLWDYKFSKGKESAVTIVQKDLIRIALDAGKSVIVSDTNLNTGTRHLMTELAADYGIEIEWHVIDQPFHQSMKWNAKRPNHVPESVMIHMQRRMRSYMGQYVQCAESRAFETTYLPRCVIVDIDGTMADMKGVRQPFEWDKVREDKPIQFVVDHVRHLYEVGRKVILFSGRDSVCRRQTQEWLADYAINYHGLYMRPEGSNENDSVIKETLFDDHVKDKFSVDYIIDDRKQVCVHWESMGFRVMNVGGFTSDF